VEKKKKKRTKRDKPSDEVVVDICDIVIGVEEEFRNKPEYYRAFTVRIIDYLLKVRPDSLPREWRGR